MKARAVFTVVTKSHLASARVLAQSLARHNPGLPLYALLADEPEGVFDPEAELFRVIRLDELGEAATVRRMAFYYSAFEFCNALKAALHNYVLKRTELDEWLYLDSDILVCGDLQPMFAELARSSILLHPHLSRPHEPRNAEPQETTLLSHGIYNGGFLGVRRTATATAFVAWFLDRLERFGFRDGGMFVDQLWLNLAPLLFNDVGLCTHPGANVGHWNLYDRQLSKDADGGWKANGEPLLWMHFSGWDIRQPERVSKYAPMYCDWQDDGWAELGRQYQQLLIAHGIEQTQSWPYAFARFEDGTPVTAAMRRHYFRRLQAGQMRGDPFQKSREFRKECEPRFARLRSLMPESLKVTLRPMINRLRTGARERSAAEAPDGQIAKMTIE